MKNTKKMVLTAMFAALTCAATLVLPIPTPGTGGYIHPGDALVILSGVFLGPLYGFLAAGIGSAMSDLIGGYLLYLPATLLIKGLIAMGTGFLFQKMGSSRKKEFAAVTLGGILDIILVVGGYGFYEFFLYGWAAAAANFPANALQGTGGLVISLILYPLLRVIPNLQTQKHRPTSL